MSFGFLTKQFGPQLSTDNVLCWNAEATSTEGVEFQNRSSFIDSGHYALESVLLYSNMSIACSDK